VHDRGLVWLTRNLLQPPYTSGLADKNVFDKAEEEEGKQGSYSKYEPEKSVLDEMPDEYPFNELKGGHTWHEWQGESVMDALGEHNALDDGTTKEESYELGEHSLGRPFKKVEPAAAAPLTARKDTIHAYFGRGVGMFLTPRGNFGAVQACEERLRWSWW